MSKIREPIIRCRSCNSMFMTYDTLDKDEKLCDICYLSFLNPHEYTITLKLSMKTEHNSAYEMLKYFQDVALYTQDVDLFDIRVNIPEDAKEKFEETKGEFEDYE